MAIWGPYVCSRYSVEIGLGSRGRDKVKVDAIQGSGEKEFSLSSPLLSF